MADEWQDIATAPKDGTELLLYGVCWDRKLRGKYSPDINVGWFSTIGKGTGRHIACFILIPPQTRTLAA